MKDWLATRTPRERQILLAGAVILVVLMLYGLVWHPFRSGLDTVEKRVQEQQSLLQWMRGASREVRALRGRRATAGGGGGKPTLSLVDQTARESGLSGAVRRMEPDNSGGVRVWLQQAPFDQVVEWLGGLQQKNGLLVQTLSVEDAGVPGQVNGRVVLQGAQ